jgi:hypothetical protein
MGDVPLELTAEHKRVLATIGESGGTRTRLVEMADSRELDELERAGYVWREYVELSEPITHLTQLEIWYLTDLGATAIGLDPERIYRA